MKRRDSLSHKDIWVRPTPPLNGRVNEVAEYVATPESEGGFILKEWDLSDTG